MRCGETIEHRMPRVYTAPAASAVHHRAAHPRESTASAAMPKQKPPNGKAVTTFSIATKTSYGNLTVRVCVAARELQQEQVTFRLGFQPFATAFPDLQRRAGGCGASLSVDEVQTAFDRINVNTQRREYGFLA